MKKTLSVLLCAVLCACTLSAAAPAFAKAVADAEKTMLIVELEGENALEMLGAINRAKEVYEDQPRWKKLVETGMKKDFSWKQSAKLYIGLYEELCSWES